MCLHLLGQTPDGTHSYLNRVRHAVVCVVADFSEEVFTQLKEKERFDLSAFIISISAVIGVFVPVE